MKKKSAPNAIIAAILIAVMMIDLSGNSENTSGTNATLKLATLSRKFKLAALPEFDLMIRNCCSWLLFCKILPHPHDSKRGDKVSEWKYFFSKIKYAAKGSFPSAKSFIEYVSRNGRPNNIRKFAQAGHRK